MLFNPEVDGVSYLTAEWRKAVGRAVPEDALPPTAFLLAYDAVKIAARAHHDLRLARNETRAAPGDCDAGRGAFHADSLLNYLRAVSVSTGRTDAGPTDVIQSLCGAAGGVEWHLWCIIVGGERAAPRGPTAGGRAAARWAAHVFGRVDAERRRHLGPPDSRQRACAYSWPDGQPHLHRTHRYGNDAYEIIV